MHHNKSLIWVTAIALAAGGALHILEAMSEEQSTVRIIARVVIGTSLIVLMSAILERFFHIQAPLGEIEKQLIPTVKTNLDHRSSAIQESVTNGTLSISSEITHQAEQLKTILNMFVKDRDLADILSRDIVLKIRNVLEEHVDCVFSHAKDRTATFADHAVARAALVQMLLGLKRQIEESYKWGLSVESLTPDPDERGRNGSEVLRIRHRANIKSARIFRRFPYAPRVVDEEIPWPAADSRCAEEENPGTEDDENL